MISGRGTLVDAMREEPRFPERADRLSAEPPRLIVMPPSIAPVVPSFRGVRRRPRLTRSAPTLAETVAISLGLIVTVAGLVAAGLFWNRITEPADRPAVVTTAPEPTPIERVVPIGPTVPQ